MADPSSVAGMNAFIASWFTPTSLFLLLNLVIGTIFITSRFGGGQRRTQLHDQLGSDGRPVPLFRTPSLLDRVKSINFSLYKFEQTNLEQEFHDHHQPVESDHPHSYPNPETSAPLTGAPSLLERVKSIQFLSLYRSDSSSSEKEHRQPVESEYAHPNPSQDTPIPLARATSFLGRFQSINFQSLYRSDSTSYEKESHRPVESEYSHPHQNPDNPTPLARAPSFLARLKSINFQSLYRSDSTSYEEVSHPATKKESSYHDSSRGNINSVSRSKSERNTKTAKRSSEKMKKSGSEKTAAGTSEDEEERSGSSSWRSEQTGSGRASVLEEEDCVNAKADDFIKRFKQQLRLQRLDSLLSSRNAKPN